MENFPASAPLSISDVSRLSGIPKDLLRMWERRYGYPNPLRNSKGERLYSGEHVASVGVIRQLLDQGKRPGGLIPLELTELETMVEAPRSELEERHLIGLLREGKVTELRAWAQRQVLAHGLRAFIHRIMVPANVAVGEAWARGDLAVFEEHLYTETMMTLVRQSLSERFAAGGVPRIMLTTLPGEHHSLGLLMVEALTRLSGAEVISFGNQMPFKDIRDAAVKLQVDIIGLSFSANFRQDDAVAMLSGLRQMVPPDIEVWVGGGAFEATTQLPQGITLVEGLVGVERTLVAWRDRHL